MQSMPQLFGPVPLLRCFSKQPSPLQHVSVSDGVSSCSASWQSCSLYAGVNVSVASAASSHDCCQSCSPHGGRVSYVSAYANQVCVSVPKLNPSRGVFT